MEELLLYVRVNRRVEPEVRRGEHWSTRNLLGEPSMVSNSACQRPSLSGSDGVTRTTSRSTSLRVQGLVCGDEKLHRRKDVAQRAGDLHLPSRVQVAAEFVHQDDAVGVSHVR